jgi:hypothetical protein
MRTLLLAGLVLAFSAQAADAVYRWVDKEGVIHYSAQAPSRDSKPVELPALQTYSHKNGPQNAAFAPANAPAAVEPAAIIKEVRITSPVADEVFRDPQGLVPVAVSIVPAIPQDAGLVFYLDGSAKNSKPWVSTNYTLVGVERGEHSVAVALVDSKGKELMRSPPVTFHAKPPIAR